ncbi:MAG: EamA family transporter [Candidatus Dojkabacteria bacterium]|nr:EamA family transporter [Candidatus Dojkabacteria bacterium]
MNNWFLLTIVATLFWSIGNYIDKYFVSKLFKGSSIGALMIYSSLVIGILVLPIFYILTKGNIYLPEISILFLWLSALAYFVANYYYFLALSKTETTIAIAVFQLLPVFSYMLGLIFLEESLTLNQIIGSLVVIMSSIFISIDFKDTDKKGQLKNFFIMFLSTFFYALSFFLFKFVTIDASFYLTAFWEYVGYIVFGLILLVFFPKARRHFVTTIRENGTKIVGLNILNEIINIIPKILMNYATLLAPLALVWSVNGVQPMFVFILGILLTLYMPKYFNEDISQKRLLKNSIWVIVGISGILSLYLL